MTGGLLLLDLAVPQAGGGYIDAAGTFWLSLWMTLQPMLAAFVLTVLVECAVLALLRGGKAALQACFWANVLTNPALNVLRLLLTELAWQTGRYFLAGGGVLLALEAAAVLAETWAYRAALGWAPKRALGVSLLCNAASFAVGQALAVLLPGLLT